MHSLTTAADEDLGELLAVASYATGLDSRACARPLACTV